jgi:hypothetical protein
MNCQAPWCFYVSYFSRFAGSPTFSLVVVLPSCSTMMLGFAISINVLKVVRHEVPSGVVFFSSYLEPKNDLLNMVN